MDDNELIAQILKGNLNAFTFLVNRYQKLVVHITGRMVQSDDELEDICQEVFMKVYQHLGKYRHESKLSTWIATIAYNTGINFVKKHKRMAHAGVDSQDVFLNIADSGTGDFEKKDLHRFVHEQIDLLPKHYRNVLVLYHLDEFSHQEIAQITGMPEGTVRSYLFRAKALLKEKLKLVVDDNSLNLR